MYSQVDKEDHVVALLDTIIDYKSNESAIRIVYHKELVPQSLMEGRHRAIDSTKGFQGIQHCCYCLIRIIK